MKSVAAVLLLVVVGVGRVPGAEPGTIHVPANQVISRVSRFTTGACLEDVNHEVYGGIYSQMVFGESFQEPAPAAVIRGFTTHDGHWQVEGEKLSVDSGPGPKLVSTQAPFAVGAAGVEVFLPGRVGGVAGLIVNVQEPGVGADRFIGYEISLSSEPQKLVLGRHRHNWEPIHEVPCTVPADRWVSLEVRLSEGMLKVRVDGKMVLDYRDEEHPLGPGRAGLRTFGRPCSFRKLWVRAGDRTVHSDFVAEKRWDEGISGMWRGVRRGSAAGSFGLEAERPFTGRQSQRIQLVDGEGEIGIENRGLNRWGMSLVAGKPYECSLWLRAPRHACTALVALESGSGERVLASKELQVSGDWQRHDFTLTPKESDRAGRLAIKLSHPGTLLVGHAFLQPGAWGRYKGLPVRKDVADALVEQGLTVLRYGGSMINAPEYRWKKMIGPRDRRPPYVGTWYPYSSNGWGILDFLDFCEAAGFLAVPDFNMDETPQDMADFIEYVNGPADSPWGKKRLADGHAEPYRLKYLELGNEEAVDESYWKRFKPMAEALWAKDPGVVLVVGDFAYNAPIKDPFHFEGAPRIKSLAAHQKILELARKHGRPVWFDVHVWNEKPREPDQPGGGILGLRDFGAALRRLCPGADFKVCVFEENSNSHRMSRGLAHAHAINELQRSGDLVPIVCAANCLQPDRQNDNGWDQGLLFLNPSQVWGQPSYYVTQMLARHPLPRCVAADLEGRARSALDVTARTDSDGKVLQLQVVNLDSEAVACKIQVDGFMPARSTTRVLELAGPPNADNTAEEPRRIVPRPREPLAIRDGRLDATFPPHSFTLLRLE